MVEFLSGSLTLYFFNHTHTRIVHNTGQQTLAYQTPRTVFICYKTARRWQPQTGSTGVKATPQEELLFPNVTAKLNAWESVSELPGVSGKFVSNSGGAKPIQKLKWKFTQKSWKTLKADPTGFQCNLDEDGTLLPTGEPYYPVNNAVVKLAFDLADTTQIVGNMEMYGSNRLLLRFKGRRE